jgi:hypothetical protein
MADIKVPHSPATTNTDIAAAFIESQLGLAPPVAPAAPDPRRLPQSFARPSAIRPEHHQYRDPIYRGR